MSHLNLVVFCFCHYRHCHRHRDLFLNSRSERGEEIHISRSQQGYGTPAEHQRGSQTRSWLDLSTKREPNTIRKRTVEQASTHGRSRTLRRSDRSLATSQSDSDGSSYRYHFSTQGDSGKECRGFSELGVSGGFRGDRACGAEEAD